MIDKNVVWEHKTRGTRFMTSYKKGETYEDNEYHKVIAENISYENGLVLCKQVKAKNIASFLADLPKELRNPKTDTYITNLIQDK